MFGSDEPPLTSRRNGLDLQKNIEKAFDICCTSALFVNTLLFIALSDSETRLAMVAMMVIIVQRKRVKQVPCFGPVFS